MPDPLAGSAPGRPSWPASITAAPEDLATAGLPHDAPPARGSGPVASATRPRSTPSTRWPRPSAGPRAPARSGSTPSWRATGSTSCSAASSPAPGRGCVATRRRCSSYAPTTWRTGGRCRSALGPPSPPGTRRTTSRPDDPDWELTGGAVELYLRLWNRTDPPEGWRRPRPRSAGPDAAGLAVSRDRRQAVHLVRQLPRVGATSRRPGDESAAQSHRPEPQTCGASYGGVIGQIVRRPTPTARGAEHAGGDPGDVVGGVRRGGGGLHDVAEHHADDDVDGGVELLGRSASTSYGATRSMTTALAVDSSAPAWVVSSGSSSVSAPWVAETIALQQEVVLRGLEDGARRVPDRGDQVGRVRVERHGHQAEEPLQLAQDHRLGQPRLASRPRCRRSAG